MLDERLRRRVADIAAADLGGLGDAAQERIVQRLVAEGPGLVRRARRARIATMAAGPLLAAAAAVAVLVRHPSHPMGMPEPSAALSAARPLACAGRAVPAGAAFVSSGEGAHLDLGSVAAAVADPGADARLAEVAPCRTVIALGMGRVTVHAKDLGGGELRVVARGGEVTVHGTIFAVTQSLDSLTVEVAEGRVGVKDRVGEHVVSAGGRLLVSGVGVAEGPLDAERAHAMRALVGEPEVVGFEALERVEQTNVAPPHAAPIPVLPRAAGQVAAAPAEVAEVAPPAPSAAPDPGSSEKAAPTDLLAQAEQARRAGDFSGARALYRKAADGQGPTAEAACVALARMELSLGHAAQALEATKQRRKRFGEGTLGPEALWIDVRAYRQTGDPERAKTLAEELMHRWPASPQARAAQQWLSGE